jgi:hypothetical protein
MAQIQLHPAPGLGDLLAGWFAVPQNSVTDGVTYTPGIGDILPGSFVVPQNPIRDFTKGQVQLIGQNPSKGPGMINGQPVSPGGGGSGHAGCGCGGSCAGGCGSGGGMGQLTFNPSADITQISNDFSAGNYMGVLSDTFLNIPLWVIAALGATWFMSAGHPQRVARAARAY